MIVDAVGVTKSLKTASQPLITKPIVPLKDLAMGVMMGVRDEDTVSSLAGRLARLDKQLDDKEQARIKEPPAACRLSTSSAVCSTPSTPTGSRKRPATAARRTPSRRMRSANRRATSSSGRPRNVFTGPLIDLLDSIRREKEQTIDHDNLDTVSTRDGAATPKENAKAMAKDFADYLEEHRDEIEALTIFYSQPARRSESPTR